MSVDHRSSAQASPTLSTLGLSQAHSSLGPWLSGHQSFFPFTSPQGQDHTEWGLECQVGGVDILCMGSSCVQSRSPPLLSCPSKAPCQPIWHCALFEQEPACLQPVLIKREVMGGGGKGRGGQLPTTASAAPGAQGAGVGPGPT